MCLDVSIPVFFDEDNMDTIFIPMLEKFLTCTAPIPLAPSIASLISFLDFFVGLINNYLLYIFLHSRYS